MRKHFKSVILFSGLSLLVVASNSGHPVSKSASTILDKTHGTGRISTGVPGDLLPAIASDTTPMKMPQPKPAVSRDSTIDSSGPGGRGPRKMATVKQHPKKAINTGQKNRQ